MKEVLENVNNYVVIIDENEIIKFCNEKFAKKISYSKDELLECKITEKLLYKNHFFYNIKDSFKILNESDNIYSFKNKNGNINSFIGKLHNIKWENEEAYILILNDDEVSLTDFVRKDLNIALQKYNELEKIISMVLNSKNNIVAIIDTEGNMMKIGKGWTACTGWNEEDFKNMKWPELFHPDEREKAVNLARKCKKGNIASIGINRCKCKNGEYKIFNWSCMYIKEQQIYISSASDITEEKRYESESKKYEEAFHKEVVKNEFFSNMSHEFKTPLNIIFSALQLIEHGIKNNDIKFYNEFNLEKYITSIRQNSYRLLRLVNNILDISRFNMGYFDLNLENCNIVYLVEDIVTSIVKYIEGKNIDLIFDTEFEEIILACDSEKIERIILNLISNSIKYTIKEQTRHGKIEVDLSVRNNEVLIAVKDNGIGISKEEIELIFNKFKRVDNKLNRKTEGSGIGLSLVKALVEMHKGKIWAESEVGKGTKIVFSIPIKIINQYSVYNNEIVKLESTEKCNLEFSDIYEF